MHHNGSEALKRDQCCSANNRHTMRYPNEYLGASGTGEDATLGWDLEGWEERSRSRCFGFGERFS